MRFNYDILLKQCRTSEETAGFEKMITMALALRQQHNLRTSFENEKKRK